jgi:predicted nucleic-acid-binding protein
MNAIDTNILIRFVTRDDEKQFKKASRFFREECSVESPGFITAVVLVEMVWTLRTGYNYEREEISAVVHNLLKSREIRIEHVDEAQLAVELYHSGEAEGFADAYAGLIALKMNCKESVTFDKKASRLSFYRLLT